MKKQKGITLIELLVVLAIMALILSAIFQAYIPTLKSYIRESQIAISNIEKLISFELIRKDIESAGFGVAQNYAPLAWDGNTLSIKSTLLFRNDATKCFGYIDSNTLKFFSIESAEISNSECNDEEFCYIALDLDYNLVQDSCYDISIFPQNMYLLFGLLDNTGHFDVPYNEIQYFLSSNNLLSICSPNTFELERREIQADGDFSTQPIFDCVKDFKVAFGLDTNDDGIIDMWTTNLPSGADNIRKQVKEIILFILYHEGTRDNSFTFSRGTIYLNATSTLVLGTYTPTGDDLHYRWKVSKLVIKPMNLRREKR